MFAWWQEVLEEGATGPKRRRLVRRKRGSASKTGLASPSASPNKARTRAAPGDRQDEHPLCKLALSCGCTLLSGSWGLGKWA